ncbi:MAG: PAS domain-containing sensor histidine kinase, partial [Cyclobacteriaceae bacterium]
IVWDTLAIDITDKKNAEEALKESEEKLLEAQNIGKIGHFEWNIKTDQLLWSDNLFSIYGLEKQEPNFELVKNIIHPEDYEFWNSKVKQALAEKKPLIIDLRMLKSNGEVIWIHNETKLLLDEHGSPDRMLGTAQDITERKKAEQALKESENLFRTLSEASPIAIGLYDPNGILKYVNPSGLKIMGAEKPNDLLGYDMFSDPFLTGENKELLRKGKNVAYESQVEFNQYPDDLQKKLNKQGIMYLHVIITPLGRDRINGYLVQMQDISDRVEAQIAVNESRKRLSLITNSVSGIIFLLKVEGAFQYRFEFINDFFFKNSGLKKEDFIGEFLHNKMSPELFDQHKKYYLQAIVEKRPVKWESDNPYQMTMQKGLFNIVPLLNEEDECTHLLGIVTDITDRVRAEEALKESEERYKLLSELTFEGILIHKNGLALLVNRSFCNMVGYSEEELIGKDIVRLIVYPEDFNIIQQNIENNITTPYEIRGIKKDGTIFPAEIEAKTFYINDEKRRVAAVRDITLRKQAQKELEESEEQLRELNATKDKMLSIISHDLRNPFVQMVELSKIIGNSLQNNDLEEVKMYLSMVQRISERGHTLLMNLLDWSRNQTGRLDLNIEIFDISRVILETCDLVSPAVHRKNIELRYEPVKCMVQADKNMVTTVLRNLIGNAIKFSFPGGVVIIKNVEMNNESIIKVIDFGIGMKEEHQQMLFDLSKNFTNVGTDKEKGSGLGLILCKEFVEKNNGTLTMESEYGKGSTFSFTLPLAENQ